MEYSDQFGKVTIIFEYFVAFGTQTGWAREILPLQVISDGLIALAYFTIAITLATISRRRSEIEFRRFVGLSGAFVIAGGATYALATWTIWHPDPWLESTFKTVTAIVSIGAAIALVGVAPTVVGLRSPGELEELNARLQRSNAELAEAYASLANLTAEEQATIDNLGEGVVVFDHVGRVVRNNEAAETLLQVGPGGIGRDDFDVAFAVVDAAGAPFRSESWPMGLARESGEMHDDVIGIGEGPERRWLAIAATPVRGPEPTDPVARVILTLRDVSEFRQREFENAATARLLAALNTIARTSKVLRKERIDEALAIALEQLELDHAYFGSIDRASDELVIESSVAATRDFDIDPHVGQRIALARSVLGAVMRQSDVVTIGDFGNEYRDDGTIGVLGEGAYIAVPIHAEGEPFGAIGFRSELARKQPFSDASRAFVRLVGELVSASVEHEQQRDRLDSLAFFDALTSLPNRVLLGDRIVQNIVAARRYGEKFVVLSLDLDDFAALNQSRGHLVCDHVLKTIALRLRACVRESDTVARVGGDEFVVLAPRVETVVGAATIASKLARVAAEPIVVDDVEFTVGVSVGIAVYPGDGTDMTTLLERSSEALERAKRGGGERIRFASEQPYFEADPQLLGLEAPGATIAVHPL